MGNLSVGGTGKTPHTEYLLKHLSAEWDTVVLSRGYKRTTKGFRLAEAGTDTARTIGDEPYQIFSKFPTIRVAVDEKRVHGVQMLMQLNNKPQLILLDDAFQHRYIRPGFSILLTDYSCPYFGDYMLPSGRLREFRSGSKRAQIVVVTKCPPTMELHEMQKFERKLKLLPSQQLFFSSFCYKEIVPVFGERNCEALTLTEQQKETTAIVFAAGIVRPEPALAYLQSLATVVDPVFYPDHYHFSISDFRELADRVSLLSQDRVILVVTEKDAARIVSNPDFPDELKPITYALPVSVTILQNKETSFIQKIKDYVIENTRNS